MIRVSAYRWVPKEAQGFVRDLRVRWALEEAGLAYDVRVIGRADKDAAEYRALQPFGQVPAYEEDGLTLFESAAIVLHIALRSEALSPPDEPGRAVMTAWMFAAMNTLEPHIQALADIDVFNAGEAWAQARRPAVVEAVRSRLAALSEFVGQRAYLLDRFTAADLLMIDVLRNVPDAGLLAERPNLVAYKDRGAARPAFQKALAAQLATFADHAPSS